MCKLLRSIWSTHVFHEIKLFSAIIHKISLKKGSIAQYMVLEHSSIKGLYPCDMCLHDYLLNKSCCHYLHQVAYPTQMVLSSSQYMLLQTCTFTLNIWFFLILLQRHWCQHNNFWLYTHKGEGESGPEVTTGLLRRAKGWSQLRKWCSALEVCEARAPFWDEAEVKDNSQNWKRTK